MVKIGEQWLIGDQELESLLERTIVKTIEKIKYSDPNEKITREQIMKELNIKDTTYCTKVAKGDHKLTMYGTPRKRYALRSEFETWRQTNWGRY